MCDICEPATRQIRSHPLNSGDWGEGEEGEKGRRKPDTQQTIAAR